MNLEREGYRRQIYAGEERLDEIDEEIEKLRAERDQVEQSVNDAKESLRISLFRARRAREKSPRA